MKWMELINKNVVTKSVGVSFLKAQENSSNV